MKSFLRKLLLLSVSGLSFAGGMWAESASPGLFDRTRALLEQQMSSSAMMQSDKPIVVAIAAQNRSRSPYAREEPEQTDSVPEHFTELAVPSVSELVTVNAGFQMDGRALAVTKSKGFLSGDTRDITYQWDDVAPHLLSFTLRDGAAYAVDASSCPEEISGSGECTVSVSMQAPGTGVFHDTLDVFAGADRIGALELQGMDERPGQVDFAFAPQSRNQNIEQDAADEGTRVEATFWLVNVGEMPAQFHGGAPAVFTKFEREWKKLDSSCASRTVAPGEGCQLVFGLDVKTSVPFTTTFQTQRLAHLRDQTKAASVSVHVRGLHPDIPGAVQVGDACPRPGASAEVLVIAEAEGRRLDREDVYPVVTATCVWEAQRPDGTQRCDAAKTPGVAHHPATLKRYALVEGVWQRTEAKPGHIRPTLFCSAGNLTKVRHTW